MTHDRIMIHRYWRRLWWVRGHAYVLATGAKKWLSSKGIEWAALALFVWLRSQKAIVLRSPRV